MSVEHMGMEQGINGRVAGGSAPPRSSLNRKKLLLGGIAAVAALVGLIAISLGNGGTVKIVPFASLSGKKSEFVQVYGKLDKQSIRPVRGANLVMFDLIEEKTNARLAVVYDNPSSALAANFPNASHALATGYYDPAAHHFVTNAVLTKCPSKYKEDKLDPDTFKAVEQWQKSTGLKADAR